MKTTKQCIFIRGTQEFYNEFADRDRLGLRVPLKFTANELHQKVNKNLQLNTSGNFDNRRGRSKIIINEDIKQDDKEKLRSPFRNDNDFKQELTENPLEFDKIDKIRMIAFALREEVYFELDGDQKLGIEQLQYEGAISGMIEEQQFFYNLLTMKICIRRQNSSG